ncbi:MAG: pirin family protein [Thermoanaerobaculia bacterium]|nr:pirin family protein [Thermoanaerobaculia bacterium]
MIEIRKSGDRGSFDHGWLDTKHTFSFADYHDPDFMGFRSLRVINEDVVAPGKGFGTHPHRDMEIITYVLEGALQHRDSMGTGSIIRPGDVQKMSAGTSVFHSEFNASESEPVHLLQIWILPERRGIEPYYEQHHFERSELEGRFRLVGRRGGGEGVITIHQDVNLYAAILHDGDISLDLQPDRYGWLQVARGSVNLNGTSLEQGDGAALRDETEIRVSGTKGSEILFFDLG